MLFVHFKIKQNHIINKKTKVNSISDLKMKSFGCMFSLKSISSMPAAMIVPKKYAFLVTVYLFVCLIERKFLKGRKENHL